MQHNTDNASGASLSIWQATASLPTFPLSKVMRKPTYVSSVPALPD